MDTIDFRREILSQSWTSRGDEKFWAPRSESEHQTFDIQILSESAGWQNASKKNSHKNITLPPSCVTSSSLSGPTAGAQDENDIKTKEPKFPRRRAGANRVAHHQRRNELNRWSAGSYYWLMLRNDQLLMWPEIIDQLDQLVGLQWSADVGPGDSTIARTSHGWLTKHWNQFWMVSMGSVVYKWLFNSGWWLIDKNGWWKVIDHHSLMILQWSWWTTVPLVKHSTALWSICTIIYHHYWSIIFQ